VGRFLGAIGFGAGLLCAIVIGNQLAALQILQPCFR
jgi:hypothetical protein